MNRDFRCFVDVFAELGARLANFGFDNESDAVINRAVSCNPWFTRGDIITAVESIRVQMLDREKLLPWLEPYALHYEQPKHIGIIMAGNIPLVGFFDMLCAIVCGGQAVVKYSSKDYELMSYIVGILKSIEADIPIYSLDSDSKLDAIIATGSDNTNRYFRTRFSNIPSLLRGSRYSVAVLSGDETDKQLELLSKDIFTYSGLGCRNTSHLLIPDNYDISHLATRLMSYKGINAKYRNNYLQNRALLLMSGAEFVDGEFFTLRKSTDHSLYISELTYERYSNPNQPYEWFSAHDTKLQCIVGEGINHPRAVAFGKAQYPELSDFPDAVDVIKFVKNI